MSLGSGIDTFIDNVKARERLRQLYLAELIHCAGFLQGMADRLDLLTPRYAQIETAANDCREKAKHIRNLDGIRDELDYDEGT